LTGEVDEVGTKSFCSYVVGNIPLACTIDFHLFVKWAKTQWPNFQVWSTSYPPPLLADLQASATPEIYPTEDNALVITDAPSMVWRYYQGSAYAAPEIAQAYCQAVVSGQVSGVLGLVPNPGCFPPGAVWWQPGDHPAMGWFFYQVYQYDLGSNAWYLLKNIGPTSAPDWAVYGGGAGVEVRDAVAKNPPWRYVIEWYWSDKGWQKYREAVSWGEDASSWSYLYACGGALEGPRRGPDPASLFMV
jgi:hypothetical protein